MLESIHSATGPSTDEIRFLLTVCMLGGINMFKNRIDEYLVSCKGGLHFDCLVIYVETLVCVYGVR